MTIRIKRIYDDASADDGYRVLVDRLWPRGISREQARLDAWIKDVAPSPGLRTWWNHDPDRLEEFTSRYRAELDSVPEASSAVAELREIVARGPGPTTLLYGAKDPRVKIGRASCRERVF